jgi:hypothetical protein
LGFKVVGLAVAGFNDIGDEVTGFAVVGITTSNVVLSKYLKAPSVFKTSAPKLTEKNAGLFNPSP